MTKNMPIVLTLSQIQEYLTAVDLIPLIEKGFEAYSKGEAVIPPVGELLFQEPPGDVHIKYGYIRGQAYYTIKIASGFYDNPKLGIPSSQGLMLLFSQQTGEVEAVLLDEGYLTDIRTVIASMITLKHLSPSVVRRTGVVGTGIQAKLQLEYLPLVSDCRDIMVWGRNPAHVRDFQRRFEDGPFRIHAAGSAEELCASCEVVITTTASSSPLLHESAVRKGTHITALGSDTSEKIELSPGIIRMADRVVSDSIAQSRSRGEVFQARKSGVLDENKLAELGAVIAGTATGRKNDEEITVADLTGVAVQDIMISTAVYEHYRKDHR